MKLQKGDYVVATKYSDGDPRDQFCVGLYHSETEHPIPFKRHLIVDLNGKQFRHNGFRRVRRIRQDVGTKLVAIMPEIGDINGRSIWSWVRQFEREH